MWTNEKANGGFINFSKINKVGLLPSNTTHGLENRVLSGWLMKYMLIGLLNFDKYTVTSRVIEVVETRILAIGSFFGCYHWISSRRWFNLLNRWNRIIIAPQGISHCNYLVYWCVWDGGLHTYWVNNQVIKQFWKTETFGYIW